MKTPASQILVATFYKFVPLEDLSALRARLESCGAAHGVRGIILLAPEGINSTIAGSREGIMALLHELRRDPRLRDLQWKESSAITPPFRKLRVRLKQEIVSLGVPGIDPTQRVGTYVKPSQWNDLLRDPDIIVIDTRNDYEVEIGTFQNAINPDIETFRQLPDWIKKQLDLRARPRVAMFCTGGIRCEKSTSLLKEAGLDDVFQLEGGILNYLEEIPEEDSLWEGQCFVFDERVAVGHGLALGDYALCRACRRPLHENDKRSEFYQAGISCPRCHHETTPEQKARFAERQKQGSLARSRGETLFRE